MQEVPGLIACEQCDAIHRRVALGNNEIALCGRCGAELERERRSYGKRALPLTIASLFMYIIANAFPIAEMELHGLASRTTLMGAVLSLNDEGMFLIAFLVFATTILLPLIQILGLIYLLVSMNKTVRSSAFNLLARTIQTLRPWVMIEVFLLGAIVAFVKLTNMATVVPGAALWALGALTLLLAAVFSFNPRDIWQMSLRENMRAETMPQNGIALSAKKAAEAEVR